MVSPNSGAAPEYQPHDVTPCPGALEPSIRLVDADSTVDEALTDHARHPGAVCPSRKEADRSRAQPRKPHNASASALIAFPRPAGLYVPSHLGSQQQEAQRESLPPPVWSGQAEEDLAAVVTAPDVRDQLRGNAEKILHDISPERSQRCVELGDAGSQGTIMWHRGVAHDYDLSPEQAGGPENYFLFYRRLDSGPGFEVCAVRSAEQIVSRLREEMITDPARWTDLLLLAAAALWPALVVTPNW